MAVSQEQVAAANNVFGDEFAVPEVKQAVDEQGNAIETVDAPVVADRKPRVYEAEIDLGDGSGKQVFKADSPTALTEKLIEAQTNASKEIRKLQRQLKARSVTPAVPDRRAENAQAFTPKPLSAEEAFLIVQQQPHKLFEIALQRETGLTPSEFRSEVDANRQFRAMSTEERVGAQFMFDHQEDYHPTPENAEALQAYLEKAGLARTRANLEYAFQQLLAEDALEMPPASDDKDEVDTVIVRHPRIETAVQKKKQMSGLSSRTSVQTPEPEDQEASVAEEIRNLPMDQARSRIVSALRSAAASSRR